mmetsp:Transcript_18788/g.45238  ORF Transcript_18788/g.45238 Transcript_18788/m.45238 type:complete len:780 (+) Transcript_18788:3-2342(+)
MAHAGSQHDLLLGALHCEKFLACSRQKLWWMHPTWGSLAAEVPEETQFMLVKLAPAAGASDEGPRYALLLPLISGPFRACLKASPLPGRLSLRIETGDEAVRAASIPSILFVSVGTDPFTLLKEGFAAVSDRLKTFRVREAKTLPPSIDQFGWCTWDAFYSSVNGPGILEGVRTLSEGGVPPRTLIIDDGWQDATLEDGMDQSVLALSASPPSFFSPVVLAARTAAKIALAWPVGVVMRLAQWYYETKVQSAEHDSVHITLWRFAATTFFKAPLMSKFADTMDYPRRLRSIEAAPRFLKTLNAESDFGSFVTSLKKDHGIKLVYCWHALTGYWSGVHPASSSITKRNLETRSVRPSPMPGILRVEPQLSWDPITLREVAIPEVERVGELYDNLYAYLRSCNVDGVKVDAQAAVTMLGSQSGGSAFTTSKFVRAMERSVTEHFGPENHCINCMCHPTECLYSYQDTAVARASDDFYPRDKASHATHLANVAYNSLFIGEVVQPDWDMFQSKHPAAMLHAVARAVGGCALYVSDKPGVHDFSVLRRLVLPDGSVLRACLPGRPTRDTLFLDVTSDARSALKIWNRNACGGLLAAFNIQGSVWDKVTRQNRMSGVEPNVPARLKPRDVEGLVRSPEDWFAVWATQWSPAGDLISSTLAILSADDALEITLRSKESCIASFARIHEARTRSGEQVKWAALGLEEMLNGGGAILAEATAQLSDGSVGAKMRLRGQGTMLLYCDKRPMRVFINGEKATFSWEGGRSILRVPYDCGTEAHCDLLVA